MKPNPPPETPPNSQMAQRILEQAFDLWINSEIERRKLAGTLPKGFQLFIAQVVMNVDRALDVRLNSEVKAVMKVRIRRAIEKGEAVRMGDFSEVHQIELTDADPNAGHLTMILHEGNWHIAFDFRYNKKRIENHLDAAQEFLAVAKLCLETKRYRAFFENLFAATELTAKSWLLTMPLPKLIRSSKHGYIRSLLVGHTRMGNFPAEHAKLYNKLNELRDEARYLNRTFKPEQDKCEHFLAGAEEMIRLVEAAFPRPAPSST
jgi:uncharacterized protein (UPF0332 family)